MRITAKNYGILKKIKNDILSTPTQKELVNTLQLYIVKSYTILIWQALDACAQIKHHLDEPTSKVVSVNSDKEERFKKSIYRNLEFIGKRDTLYYEHLVSNIIRMTLIDHCYIINQENINTLYLLLEGVKRKLNIIKQVEDQPLVKPVKPAILQDFTQLLYLTQIKASALIKEMLSPRPKYDDVEMGYFTLSMEDTFQKKRI